VKHATRRTLGAALSSLTLNNNSALNLDSTGANHTSQNRLADNLTINSSGGVVNLLGNSSVATTETVGTLQLNSGQWSIAWLSL
jgi:hypothetical protein